MLGWTPKFLYICQVATRGCYYRHLEKCTKQKSRWVSLSKKPALPRHIGGVLKKTKSDNLIILGTLSDSI
jgi:hypothetical protein